MAEDKKPTTPSAEDLAAEMNAALGDPDTGEETAQAAGAGEGNAEPDPQAPPAPTPEPEKSDPELEPEPEPEKAAAKSSGKKRPTPKPRRVIPGKKSRKKATDAQARKKAADTERREAAIAEQPKPSPPDERDLVELERKAEIRAEMVRIQGEIDELEAAAAEYRQRLGELNGELYPHTVGSDRPSDAVRGFVKSQAELRRTRVASGEHLKRLIAQARKAPIDAAFSPQRARGGHRPSTGMRPPPAADKSNAPKA